MTTDTTNGDASEHPGAGSRATPEGGSPDVIVLTVPATPRHAATARVVAASLAADLGFDVDEIDDLRLGLNEAVAVLAEHRIEDPTAPATDGSNTATDGSDTATDGSDTATDGSDTAGDDRLRIEFRAVPAGRESARIDVDVRRGHGAPSTPSELDELAERILSAVVDHHEHHDGAIQLSKSSRGPG